jgi:peptidoglycan hydrolase-like protein with peptidoglycan-binding domain
VTQRQLLIDAPIRSLPFEVWHGSLDVEAALAGRHPKRGQRSMGPLRGTASQIPAQTVYTLKRSTVPSIVVWSMQGALKADGVQLQVDGLFGKETDGAVFGWQMSRGLEPDGIFGPVSSRKLADRLIARSTTKVPKGALEGQVDGESGRLWGAVNWSVPGGVDCHLTQRRVYTVDYGDWDVEHRAFSSVLQLSYSALGLRNSHDSYWSASNAVKTHERAWRLALLKHNYPSMADKIAQLGINGLSSYYTSQQNWVVAIGVSWRDGAPVRTPLEWGQFYALGSSTHSQEGLVSRLVTKWNIP